MTTHHPPLSPRCDPQYLDKVRTTAEMIAAANLHTFPVAAKWLKHYLSGADGVVKADLNWLRRNIQFSQALENIRRALEYELIRAVLAKRRFAD